MNEAHPDASPSGCFILIEYLRHSRLVIWGKWHDKLQHVSSYSYNIEIMIQMEMLHFLIDWIERFYIYIFTFG